MIQLFCYKQHLNVTWLEHCCFKTPCSPVEKTDGKCSRALSHTRLLQQSCCWDWHHSNPGRDISACEPHFSSLISGRLVHRLKGLAFTWGHSLGASASGLMKSWIKHIWHFLDKTMWNLVSFCGGITDGRSRRCHILTVFDTDMY